MLDGYHFDPAYQKAIREAGYRLLVVDDTAHLPAYHADVLLNQNIYAPQLTYSYDPHTVLLLGPMYALLRPEFLVWKEWERHIPDTARHILVTLGGGDSDNVTLKVIQALHDIRLPDLEIRVIVGPANPHRDSLVAAIEHGPHSVELLFDVTDMPGLMAWADIAVSAAGSTCWELLFMGLPSLVGVLADNQVPIAEDCHGGVSDQPGMVSSGIYTRDCFIAHLADRIRRSALPHVHSGGAAWLMGGVQKPLSRPCSRA